MLEMVCCNECGTEYLKAGIESSDGIQKYVPTKPREQEIDEDFALADDSDGDEEQAGGAVAHSLSTLLLALRSSSNSDHARTLEVHTGELAASAGDLVTLYELEDASGEGTRCLCCGA
ncbi:MAG: hypothetical protein ACYC2K_17515, partial [Gemmatimonadales bacterium]